MTRRALFTASAWLETTRLALLVAAALVASAPASATTYTAAMDGTQEIGPNASPATGFSIVTVTGNVLSVDITWDGLVGGVPGAAHIHCCADLGTNVGVAIGFPSFPTVSTGSYTHDFDLLSPTTYTASFLANFGGGTAAGAAAALIAGLDARRAYTNIHNATFPGGEIRGNLVPEPSTVATLGLALAGIAALRRARTI